MSVSRFIARPLLASMFLVGGVNALRKPVPLAQRAEPVLDAVQGVLAAQGPAGLASLDAPTLVRANGAAQVLAGLGLATGRAPRLCAGVLAASLVPTTAGGHRFWEETDPAARSQQQTHFVTNLSMLGGLLIAAGDTDGRPGLAWRARRAAQDGRREARQLARTARREAKLAKAQLT